MNAQICQASYVDSPWFGGRIATAATEATRAAIDTFQSVWREQSKQTDRFRAMEMMIDVNDRTLKDIGAPDWMIARANERRNAHYIHLIELFRS